jgi:hypothetical protein
MVVYNYHWPLNGSVYPARNRPHDFDWAPYYITEQISRTGLWTAHDILPETVHMISTWNLLYYWTKFQHWSLNGSVYPARNRPNDFDLEPLILRNKFPALVFERLSISCPKPSIWFRLGTSCITEQISRTGLWTAHYILPETVHMISTWNLLYYGTNFPHWSLNGSVYPARNRPYDFDLEPLILQKKFPALFFERLSISCPKPSTWFRLGTLLYYRTNFPHCLKPFVEFFSSVSYLLTAQRLCYFTVCKALWIACWN